MGEHTPHTELPAARIRAALDAGHGIAVLTLMELADPADAARLVGGDRADVHLVHLHVARTVSRCGGYGLQITNTTVLSLLPVLLESCDW
ncbi:hypothetical protein [Streptomyces sp. WAC00263]|uniref:hypothetical protein n=1 Tax=Streptomyces sp. WAC00263 TaxID=1917422 RepID=UPI0015EFA926|nr:hypothetical protein [Streptomyces sp. WAC00263]KAF5998689.1 hypothetical protein BOG92_049715 [Streptomyces sp. WAC00263]